MRQGPLRAAACGRGEGALLRIYLDELTLSGLLAARREARRQGVRAVHVLEALPGRLRGWPLQALARAFGVQLVPEAFFAGHLRANGAEVANLVAFRRTGPLAMDAARHAVQSLSLLREVGAAWSHQPLLLRVARTLWLPVFGALLRIEVAGALAARDGERAILVAYRRAGITEAIGKEHPVEIRWYGGDRLVRTLASRLTFLWWIRHRLSGLQFRWQAAIGRAGRQLAAIDQSADPVVLMPQEEEPSSDWSYRTQPHWLQNGSSGVQAVVLGNQVFPGQTGDPAFAPVSPGEVHALPAAPGVGGALRRMLARVTLRVLWCPVDEAPALAATARLLYYADRMAAVVVRTRARAFLCCENVMIQADAMQLVARAMGVRTAAFQYSNMGLVTPGMLTALDNLLTFGPTYHDRWKWDGWGGCCVATGYPFDYVFALVRERGVRHREALAVCGARFVIAYFDESVQSKRWGLIHPDDHAGELGRLLDLLLEDQSLAVVLKVQFQKNAASGHARLRDRLDAARKTGRLLELSHGRQRNTVFPAEAALTADLAIGHIVGGTASLEAALAGRRSVLLNPYGYVGANNPLYARADIVYGSMAEALDAVARHRRGEPGAARLGDWSDILPSLDSFRDGRAADRLRAFVTRLAKGEDDVLVSRANPAYVVR